MFLNYFVLMGNYLKNFTLLIITFANIKKEKND